MKGTAMRLADPWFLLLLVLPLAWLLRRWADRRRPPMHRLGYPVYRWLAEEPASRRVTWSRALPAVRVTGLSLLVLALARPQVAGDVREVSLRARNIMIVLDISSSMKAKDFQPGNRVEVARALLNRFVARRGDDLIGLVTFAGRAFLQAPLNADTALLERTLAEVDIGQISDGTAIGSALALALNQLKDLPAKASMIVLVTDGANNTGQPGPAQAAEAARALGVKIHAIGLSSVDTSRVELNGVWSVGSTAARLTRWDEKTLARIADRTGGRYYRATDPEALQGILDQIDQAERAEVKVPETRQYRELYAAVLVPALLLLLLEFALGLTWLRSLVS
jgi:Ca-activated chloride channel homolog